MGQFSAPNYEQHDEQNDWSPYDEQDDAPEPEEYEPRQNKFTESYNEEYPF